MTPRIKFHVGPTDTGWWIYLFRTRYWCNGIAVFGIAWGWDQDVPWSWLPTVHQHHHGQRLPSGEIRFASIVWLSWLGFSIGQTSKSKWVLSEEVNDGE